MKHLTTIALLLLSFWSSAQLSEVKFREETFANGMNYPQVTIPASKPAEDSINTDIRRRISDIEKSDFCIGQYGYVQKSTHIQIHIYCNCIDFAESQNRYFFYDLESGKNVPYNNIFKAEKVEAAKQYLIERARNFATSNEKTLSPATLEAILANSIDAFVVELTRDGLKLSIPDLEDKVLELTWVELKPFLKYHFM